MVDLWQAHGGPMGSAINGRTTAYEIAHFRSLLLTKVGFYRLTVRLHVLPSVYYQSTTRLLPAYYQSTTSLLPVYYSSTTSLLLVYYQSTTSNWFSN